MNPAKSTTYSALLVINQESKIMLPLQEQTGTNIHQDTKL
jgi:hypothetical protein